VQRNGGVATAVVRDWRAELHGDIAAKLGVEVEVEPLTLEDIFLELHR
jgi:preprotein translocase subunit SecA